MIVPNGNLLSAAIMRIFPNDESLKVLVFLTSVPFAVIPEQPEQVGRYAVTLAVKASKLASTVEVEALALLLLLPLDGLDVVAAGGGGGGGGAGT